MDVLAPEINVHRRHDRLSLDVVIWPECLPPGRLLHLGLSAVVEGVDGTLSYWALRHFGKRPDFHHPDAFVRSLVLPSMRDAERRNVGNTA